MTVKKVTSLNIKRAYFRISLQVIALIALIFIAIFSRKVFRADAQVTNFYPTTCLGGWKNTENAVGEPQVVENGLEGYDIDNSATIENSVSQMFCGGFKGEIPADVLQKKVVLKFSWSMETPILDEEKIETLPEKTEPVPPTTEVNPIEDNGAEEGNEVLDGEVLGETDDSENAGDKENPAEEDALDSEFPSIPADESPVESATTIEVEVEVSPVTAEPAVESAVVEEESSVETEQEPEGEESTSEPVSSEQSFFHRIFNVAYAEEIELSKDILTEESSLESKIELTDDSVVVSKEEIKIPDDALLEILYTLDGESWVNLGYVSVINSNQSFELPLAVFATVADLEKAQIAVKTLMTIDELPTIYLDSLWLEVEYDDPFVDPLAPPDVLKGDIIVSEVVHDNLAAIVATRAISGRMELWLHNLEPGTDGWFRIAEDDILAIDPQVQFVDGNVFWIGKEGMNAWKFNPGSSGYDSISVSEGATPALYYDNGGGQKRVLKFEGGYVPLEFETVKPVKNEKSSP